MITERDLDAHVAWCQSPHQRGPWIPARDLLLVEELLSGRGLGVAADTVGLTPDEALARWDALYPPEVRSVTLQPVLLRILRRNADATRLRLVAGGGE